MGTSDLIRLAEELARCGGVHRLTNLVTAAIHVLREHDQRRTVEAWEDGPETGVGMTDKVALASTPAGPAIIDRYKADRDAASRAPEGAEASGEIEENVGESRLSCYKRPVEEVQLPDGSNQWQEGPRQWLSETYPNENTISSGLPVCTSIASPTGRMSASTAETQPTPSITFNRNPRAVQTPGRTWLPAASGATTKRATKPLKSWVGI